MKDRIIEGRYTVIGEMPVRPKRRLPPVVRYVLTQRLFWVWAFALTVVGLTEGLW